MPSGDDPTTEQLEAVQSERAQREADEAEEADQPEDELAHQRRSDKAAYLRDKLAEQAESEGD
jgi:hypothetical protein